jgi:endogenous inhibitor of DNA gyrase (YacG/DUF329 family)
VRLNETEVDQVQSLGLRVTAKCDNCGRVLNQPTRYTVVAKPQVYCTAGCRDRALLGPAKLEGIIESIRCFRCHGPKHAGGLYCTKCQPFADPHGAAISAKGLPCPVCGESVPVLRRSNGGETCSQKCKEVLMKRNQRERAYMESPEEQVVPL